MAENEDKPDVHVDKPDVNVGNEFGPQANKDVVNKWGKRQVLQWLLDVDMAQHISIFHTAQIIGHTLIELTPEDLQTLGIDEQSSKAIVMLRDHQLIGEDETEDTTEDAPEMSWDELKPVVLKMCIAQTYLPVLAYFMRRLEARVQFFEVSILILASLATTFSVLTLSGLDDDAAFAVNLTTTVVTAVASLFSGALNLLGWRDSLEKIKSKAVEFATVTYDFKGAITSKTGNVKEIRKSVDPILRELNALWAEYDLDQYLENAKNKMDPYDKQYIEYSDANSWTDGTICEYVDVQIPALIAFLKNKQEAAGSPLIPSSNSSDNIV